MDALPPRGCRPLRRIAVFYLCGHAGARDEVCAPPSRLGQRCFLSNLPASNNTVYIPITLTARVLLVLALRLLPSKVTFLHRLVVTRNLITPHSGAGEIRPVEK